MNKMRTEYVTWNQRHGWIWQRRDRSTILKNLRISRFPLPLNYEQIQLVIQGEVLLEDVFEPVQIRWDRKVHGRAEAVCV